MRGNDGNFHERLRSEERIVVSSNRSFGITIAGVLALIGLVKLWTGAGGAPYWGSAAALVLTVAALAPAWLAPFNRQWARLGMVLYRVVNPVVMAVLFFLVVTPTAWLMRLVGKRPLSLDWEPDAPSYWTERRASPPRPDSMQQQF